MRRKKAVKIAIYISVVSLFLSGTVASSVYAAEGDQGLVEAETGQKGKKTAEKTTDGNGKETQTESPLADKDAESESPLTDKDAEPENSSTDKDAESESPLTDKDAEPENSSADKDTEPDSFVEQDVKFSGTTDDKSDDITEKDDEKAADKEKVSEENAEGAKAERATVRLEVPQKFDIVLDPWEMDGKGQIYSEKYTIKNISGEKGTLTLTGIAVGEEVDIQPDDSSIYDGDGRNLFIEMVVNEEDRLTLLPEGADYEATLEADESVTFTFTGKMNETAAAGWRGGDVKVMVIYDWVEEPGEDIAEEEKKDPEEEKNLNTDVLAESDKEERNTPDAGMSAEDNKGEDADAGKPAEDDEGEKDPDVDTSAESGNEEGKVPDVDVPTKDNQEAGEVSGTDMLTEADSTPLGADLPEDSDTKK